MSNQAINAWMKSFLRQSSVKGALKARSAGLTVYRSMVNAVAGSVTHALISTVSTSGSVRAVSFKGEKSKP